MERKRCDECGEYIDGTYLELDGGILLHPSCLVCCKCERVIDGELQVADGKRHCLACVPKERCKSCGQDIQGPFSCVEGAKYHPECLRCSACSLTLSGDVFVGMEGLICERCSGSRQVGKTPSLHQRDDENPCEQGASCIFESSGVAVHGALRGFLYKKKPTSLSLKRWDWRYFVVGDLKVQWWRSKEEYEMDKPCRGCIDISTNLLDVRIATWSMDRFFVMPQNGRWEGTFTGAASGRHFEFDVTNSDHTREAWMEAICKEVQLSKNPQAAIPEASPAAAFDEDDQPASEVQESGQAARMQWQPDELSAGYLATLTGPPTIGLSAAAQKSEQPMQTKITATACQAQRADQLPPTQNLAEGSTLHIAPLPECRADQYLSKMEQHLMRLSDAATSVVRRVKAQNDLLSNVGMLADFISATIQVTADKERKELMKLLGGDCERAAKARSLMEATSAKLSETDKNDSRIQDLRRALDVAEAVIREKGLGWRLKEAQQKYMPWRTQVAYKAPAEKPSAVKSPVSQTAFEADPVSAPKEDKVHTSSYASSGIPVGANAVEAKAHPETFELTEPDEHVEEDDMDVTHDIAVVVSGFLKPEFDFGTDDTFVMQLPNIGLEISTAIRPPLDVRQPETSIEHHVESLPELRHLVFNPATALPAGGRLAAACQAKFDVLDVPGSAAATASLTCRSPLSSITLRDARGETTLHYELEVSGKLTASQRSSSHLLQVELVLEARCFLSGAGSCAFTEDGLPVPAPQSLQERGAMQK